ncbi:hypothetical protein [Marinobacter sp. LV10MA510-1]|uniref:hypothetical protein n=1 Tax=Marinobacter sp. LV10MA510-1 TaxID=1415567 RepID=UPI000BF8D0CF|nr:hypothetical protein [Marinobacter sp. LV10MA510-1]PFG09093.1 hypothetical protein ATI45_1447 [Marinobacter sp. LV10MA510-1]
MKTYHFWRPLLRAGLLSAALATTLSVMSASAQELIIPLGQQGDRDVMSLPQTGMKAERVRERWGSPGSTGGPVGQPPISQWHYPAFVVYFESERIIRAVMKRTP